MEALAYNKILYGRDIIEESQSMKVRIKNRAVSCYIAYQRLENQRYHKSLISPLRSNFRWILSKSERNDRCTAIIKEPSLTASLAEGICGYIREELPGIQFITIDICQSEDITHIREIEKAERYYMGEVWD
jgi:hypothetical protein